MEERKIKKDYDIKGNNSFMTVFANRESNIWEKINTCFINIWYKFEIWYHSKKRYLKNMWRFRNIAKNYFLWDMKTMLISMLRII